MIRLRKRLMLVAAGAVVAGAAIGTATLTAGTAHAQAAGSIAITGATIGPPPNNTRQVDVSVTCPAGGLAGVSLTVIQGGTTTAGSGQFKCTGTAQQIALTLDSTPVFGTGPAFAGATLEFSGTSLGSPTTYYGTTATVNFP
jgi:hypothetical protein